MRLRRAIPAGLVDSGFASLATFVLNLYAIATWEADDPTTLAIYFLYMTAFLMASMVSTQLIFVPAERITLDVDQPARAALLGRISRTGFPASAASASLLLFATGVGMSKGMDLSGQVPLLITAGVATAFSPVQNHARRLLHLAGHSWAAAGVSAAQLGGAAAALAVFTSLDIPAGWIPIGALATANIVSYTTAVLLSARFAAALDSNRKAAATELRRRFTYRELAPTGRWLMATGVISTGNNFLVESAVFSLASPEALALAGAAKTVAQPILVLANGLRSVLGPPSMEAARKRNRNAARKMRRTFGGLTLVAVTGYVAIAGFDWVGNPLARLVDQAYTVPFLVALTIVANGFNSAAFAGRLELIGAERERRLFAADLRSNIGQLIVAVAWAAAAGSAVTAGSFARPVAFAVLGLMRIVDYDRQLVPHYAEVRPDPVGATTGDPLPPVEAEQ